MCFGRLPKMQLASCKIQELNLFVLAGHLLALHFGHRRSSSFGLLFAVSVGSLQFPVCRWHLLACKHNAEAFMKLTERFSRICSRIIVAKSTAAVMENCLNYLYIVIFQFGQLTGRWTVLMLKLFNLCSVINLCIFIMWPLLIWLPILLCSLLYVAF